ncbi:hypothetical protein BDD12DRAFT_914312 [Trichophaea hybrida]|nr:hypothetical protein BDD12DRAFT_914312 [Trichophaea hybrida]
MIDLPIFGQVCAATLPETSTATEPEPISIIPDGDLILHVESDSEVVRYLVFSQILCSTSAVFRKMLGKESSFAEAVALQKSKDSDEPVVVRLEDDDLTTMGVVLRVLHSRNYLVPRKMVLQDMVHTAVICDKYEFHEGLQFITDIWLKSLKLDTTSIDASPEDWLLISWVFGPEDIFTQVSRSLVLRGLKSGDDMVFGNDKLSLSESVPSAISDEIFLRRQQCVDSIRAYIKNLEKRYFREDYDNNIVCPSPYDPSTECDSLQADHLYRSFHCDGAHIVLSENTPLNQIMDTIKAIPVLQYFCCGMSNPCYHGYPSNRHSNCSWVPGLHQKVDSVLADVKGLMFSEFPSRM